LSHLRDLLSADPSLRAPRIALGCLDGIGYLTVLGRRYLRHLEIAEPLTEILRLLVAYSGSDALKTALVADGRVVSGKSERSGTGVIDSIRLLILLFFTLRASPRKPFMFCTALCTRHRFFSLCTSNTHHMCFLTLSGSPSDGNGHTSQRLERISASDSLPNVLVVARFAVATCKHFGFEQP